VIEVADGTWVRRWAGKVISLIEDRGETVVVYMSGGEVEMPKSLWTSLPVF
jgi:hypothetical protein